jgi:outer membrane immunogenic protein
MKNLFATGCILAMIAALFPLSASAASASSNWSGCYIGIHAGVMGAQRTVTDVGNGSVSFASGGTPGQAYALNNNNAILFGGQTGCNFKTGPVMLGPEIDLGRMNLLMTGLDPGTTSSTSIGMNSGIYGDVAVRVGVPVDNVLLYGKGGGAFFNGSESFSTLAPTATVSSHLPLFKGYVAGAGVEYLFRSRFSAKIEYAYYNFPTQTFDVASGNGNGTYLFSESMQIHTLQAGLNYRFSLPNHWRWR